MKRELEVVTNICCIALARADKVVSDFEGNYEYAVDKIALRAFGKLRIMPITNKYRG